MPSSHLFIELEELHGEGRWAESARWNHAMEEDLLEPDDGGTRRKGKKKWSRPHLPTVSVPALVRLRRALGASNVLLDVPVTLSMEVGRARVPIRNLLQLNQGSVVELERVAGEPLDVYANGTLIAHGEVVVINEKFGIRLIDVVSPAERIRKLK